MANTTAFRMINKNAQRTFKKDFLGMTGLQFNRLFEIYKNKVDKDAAMTRVAEAMRYCKFNSQKAGRGVAGWKLFDYSTLVKFANELRPLFEEADKKLQVEEKKNEIIKESSGFLKLIDLQTMLHMVSFDANHGRYYVRFKEDYNIDTKRWGEHSGKNYVSGWFGQVDVDKGGFIEPNTVITALKAAMQKAEETWERKRKEYTAEIAAVEEILKSRCF